jgi:hypothetical protein
MAQYDRLWSNTTDLSNVLWNIIQMLHKAILTINITKEYTYFVV